MAGARRAIEKPDLKLVRGAYLLVLATGLAFTIQTSLMEQSELMHYRITLSQDALQFYCHACITCLACALAPLKMWPMLALAIATGGAGLELAQDELTVSRTFEMKDLMISSIGVGTGVSLTFAITLAIAMLAAGWSWAGRGGAVQRMRRAEFVGR